MDRLLEMEVFVAVNEMGSFNKAAERMRMSPPAITRAVSSLEGRLGITLLTRTTRRLHLTDAGVRFLESAQRLLGEIDIAEKNASGEMGVPQGHLTISASVTFGRYVITPMVRGFLQAHPKITATVLGLDRVVNMVDEGVDVAVRIGELPGSSLIARRVGQVRRVFVASPDYLARRGSPVSPQDIKLHSVIGFANILTNQDWYYKTPTAKGHVTLTPRLEVNDASAAIEAALAGEGITMAMSYLVGDLICQKRLVPVLMDYVQQEVPVHLVFPQSRLIAPKLRAFLDYSADRLKDELAQLSL
ncbi:MAG: LysR substrate-binding domain-containing protein [Amylibacter sp.]